MGTAGVLKAAQSFRVGTEKTALARMPYAMYLRHFFKRSTIHLANTINTCYCS